MCVFLHSKRNTRNWQIKYPDLYNNLLVLGGKHCACGASIIGVISTNEESCACGILRHRIGLKYCFVNQMK